MSMLFSEVYGCYYGIITRVLNRSVSGLSKKQIEEIVNTYGFSETAFHVLPELLDGEWSFLDKRGEKYFSKFPETQFCRPLTGLELSWLAALLDDFRIRLFLSEEKHSELKDALKGIRPAFLKDDIFSVDRHLDGDPYDNPTYISNFRQILNACKNNIPLVISYDSEKNGRSQRTYHPYKLSYSELNDKFRLLCAVYNTKSQKLSKVTLNLGRIISATPSDLPYRADPKDLKNLFSEPNENPPIVIELTKERNALERFLLQFASYDRKTEYDAERNIYTCQIFYDLGDETELLIRILGFGPTVRVLGPQRFLEQLKERIRKQVLDLSID
jgi:predicted DNA-binding transcriptional regulator YafY